LGSWLATVSVRGFPLGAERLLGVIGGRRFSGRRNVWNFTTRRECR